MDSLSVLNTQNIALSNNTQVESKSKEELAAEDAEQQKTEFLLLLLTQLENQNPLDPLDTDEFTAQLTRYSILEQGIETNAKLETANDYLKANALNTTLGYIGEEVEVSSNTAPVQDGVAKWSYTINGDADEVVLVVLDEDGELIHEEDGNTFAGVHDFTFDAAALGLEDGESVELLIAALDADKKTLDGRITSTATIDGVWTDETNTYLTSGSVSYRKDDILKVNEL